MKLRTLLLSLILPLLSVAVILACNSADSKASEAPQSVEKFLKNYYAVICKEDKKAFEELLHPNGDVKPGTVFEGWKNFDPRPAYTKIELLFSDDDLAILRVHTKTHFPEYPLDEITTELVTLRKWEGSWRLWSESLLDSRKDG
jgi:hypothetical protein